MEAVLHYLDVINNLGGVQASPVILLAVADRRGYRGQHCPHSDSTFSRTGGKAQWTQREAQGHASPRSLAAAGRRAHMRQHICH